MRGRFSLARFVLVVLVLVVATAGAVEGARTMVAVTPPAAGQPWYAPYVDVTLTPEYQFQDPDANPSNDAVLGFIVAAPDGACVPTWGTYYGLGGAERALGLDRRIARLAERGGQVIVSFGGEANSELAVDCSEPALVHAYASVIDRYHVRTLDFDIEGAALANAAANERRALALAALQARAEKHGHELRVWLTLPASQQGLPSSAVALVQEMLVRHVRLAGVNLLTMDFGDATGAPLDMVSAISSTMEVGERQLAWLYRRDGVVLSPQAVWHKLGMTPMIGQNDDLGETVSVADAQQLLTFAQQHGLGRVSIWSLNRDTNCGAQLGVGVVSNLCSGVAQTPLAFSYVFDELPERPTGGLEPQTAPAVVLTQTPDNPATSPYPIWSPRDVYRAGAQVTWHHDVFQAKWYSQDDNPDAPVAHEWDTPWMYVGPVLPGDKPIVIPRLKPGVYPAWSQTATYDEGERVELQGIAYQAQWWTQGTLPNPNVAAPWDSPWLLIKR